MRSYQKPVDVANETLVRDHCLVPEHVNRVIDLVNAGRDKEHEAIGVHGTSLTALVMAMKSGSLPAGRASGCEGHIYFFPLSHAQVNREGLQPLTTDPSDNDRVAFDEAAGYASDRTREALGAKALGLDMSSDVGWRLATNLSEIVSGQDIEGAELLAQQQINERHVLQLVRGLEKVHRGFVLFIGKSAFDECAHGIGDPGYGDLKLQVPAEGLSLKHLVGIEPLSDEDFDTISELEEKFKPS
jgi:hypothetical protein